MRPESGSRFQFIASPKSCSPNPDNSRAMITRDQLSGYPQCLRFPRERVVVECLMVWSSWLIRKNDGEPSLQNASLVPLMKAIKLRSQLRLL